mgnify:CR=1 FL=1
METPKINNQNTEVIFTFTPNDYFLVYNQKGEEYQWSLNPRIDRSYKGKDDDCGTAKFYLTVEEAEMCKKAGFDWITY